MKNDARNILILLTAARLACTTSYAFGESAEPDYYQIGLDVTALMSEIVDSDAYLSILTIPKTVEEVREKVNTHDYDRPAAVYSVRLSDFEAFFQEMLLKDAKTAETWNSLSPALQEQLLGRISLRSMCSGVNARTGTDAIAFSSVATAFVRNESLTGAETSDYLYIFEEGTPILVSFGYHSASGFFLFIPKESQGSPEKIRAYMNLPYLEISPVKAAESADSDS